MRFGLALPCTMENKENARPYVIREDSDDDSGDGQVLYREDYDDEKCKFLKKSSNTQNFKRSQSWTIVYLLLALITLTSCSNSICQMIHSHFDSQIAQEIKSAFAKLIIFSLSLAMRRHENTLKFILNSEDCWQAQCLSNRCFTPSTR